MRPLNLDQNAVWKQRFRAPSVPWSTVATRNPTRGAAITNRSGVYQLYSWNVLTGDMQQITNLPTGLRSGHISADGRHLYYFHDKQGDEIGHYMRVPFEGGEAQDVTPDLPPYPSFSFGESFDGSTLGFVAAGASGFQAFVIKDGQRTMIFSSPALSFGPILSY